jgi:hypothetical protein
MFKKIIALSALGIILASCGVNPDKAKQVLESQGIKNPVVGGYAWFSCSKDDSFGSNWTGEGQNGKQVSGVICGGWLKGYTVRFD